jgi:hypothetical protein
MTTFKPVWILIFVKTGYFTYIFALGFDTPWSFTVSEKNYSPLRRQYTRLKIKQKVGLTMLVRSINSQAENYFSAVQNHHQLHMSQ